MSLTLTEKPESRESRQDKGPDGVLRTVEVELKYILEGTSNDAAARGLLESTTPTTYDGLERGEISLNARWVDTVAGDGVWDAEVQYLLPEKDEPETGDSSYSFDTTGGRQRMTQSHHNVGNWRPGGPGTRHFGAIGVTRRGGVKTVEGVDVIIPAFAWSEMHYVPDELVTDAYKGALRLLTGCTNLEVFKGHQPGECLFLGARGSKRGDEDWGIAFEFASSPNIVDIRGFGLKSAGFNDPIPKKGWDYVWFEYRENVDGDTKEMAMRPCEVHIDQVYPEDDFSELQIGT